MANPSPVQPQPQELGDPIRNDDGAPAGGFTFATATTNAAGTTKVTGSSGNDRITFDDIYRDSDQVINTGAGDDIFSFRGDESKNPQEKVNAIIDFGAGGNDTVVLAFQASDYKFIYRSDGIKIQYVGADGLADGPAITFKNAETFIFRNIDSQTGENFGNTELTTQELYDLVGFGTAPGTPVASAAGSGVEA